MHSQNRQTHLNRDQQASRQAGFTLLEILVALAIFALLSSAIAGQNSASLKVQSRLTAATNARHIAENLAEEYQLQNQLGTPGLQQLSVSLDGELWPCELLFESTSRADMQKLTISVSMPSSTDKQAVAELVTYLGAH